MTSPSTLRHSTSGQRGTLEEKPPQQVKEKGGSPGPPTVVLRLGDIAEWFAADGGRLVFRRVGRAASGLIVGGTHGETL